MYQKLSKYSFLFEELVKRDFKKKYKRTILGMGWSILAPLLQLLVLRIVFTQFFGRNMDHYTIYLFCGTLLFSYFSESTGQGMLSLIGNASIFTKVNIPKYLFLFSKNVQALINFGLVLVVFFIFCILDGITFTWKFILLLYPVISLLLFNIGVGLILSALFVFFRDIQYLWGVFTQLLMYMSAIFILSIPTVQSCRIFSCWILSTCISDISEKLSLMEQFRVHGSTCWWLPMLQLCLELVAGCTKSTIPDSCTMCSGGTHEYFRTSKCVDPLYYRRFQGNWN